MTRPLALPENQVRAIIRAAWKEGARRVEVRIGGAVVAVYQDDDGKHPMDKREEIRL